MDLVAVAIREVEELLLLVDKDIDTSRVRVVLLLLTTDSDTDRVIEDSVQVEDTDLLWLGDRVLDTLLDAVCVVESELDADSDVLLEAAPLAVEASPTQINNSIPISAGVIPTLHRW